MGTWSEPMSSSTVHSVPVDQAVLIVVMSGSPRRGYNRAPVVVVVVVETCRLGPLEKGFPSKR